MKWKASSLLEICNRNSDRLLPITIVIVMTIVLLCSCSPNTIVKSDPPSPPKQISSSNASSEQMPFLENTENYIISNSDETGYMGVTKYYTSLDDVNDEDLNRIVDIYCDITHLLEINVISHENPVNLTGHLMYIARGNGGGNLAKDIDVEKLKSKYPPTTDFFGVTNELIDKQYFDNAVSSYICEDSENILIDAEYYYIESENLYTIPLIGKDINTMPIISSYTVADDGRIEVLISTVRYAGTSAGAELFGFLQGESDISTVGEFETQKYAHPQYGEIELSSPKITAIQDMVKLKFVFCNYDSGLKIHSITLG